MTIYAASMINSPQPTHATLPQLKTVLSGLAAQQQIARNRLARKLINPSVSMRTNQAGSSRQTPAGSAKPVLMSIADQNSELHNLKDPIEEIANPNLFSSSSHSDYHSAVSSFNTDDTDFFSANSEFIDELKALSVELDNHLTGEASAEPLASQQSVSVEQAKPEPAQRDTNSVGIKLIHPALSHPAENGIILNPLHYIELFTESKKKLEETLNFIEKLRAYAYLFRKFKGRNIDDISVLLLLLGMAAAGNPLFLYAFLYMATDPKHDGYTASILTNAAKNLEFQEVVLQAATVGRHPRLLQLLGLRSRADMKNQDGVFTALIKGRASEKGERHKNNLTGTQETWHAKKYGRQDSLKTLEAKRLAFFNRHQAEIESSLSEGVAVLNARDQSIKNQQNQLQADTQYLQQRIQQADQLQASLAHDANLLSKKDLEALYREILERKNRLVDQKAVLDESTENLQQGLFTNPILQEYIRDHLIPMTKEMQDTQAEYQKRAQAGKNTYTNKFKAANPVLAVGADGGQQKNTDLHAIVDTRIEAAHAGLKGMVRGVDWIAENVFRRIRSGQANQLMGSVDAAAKHLEALIHAPASGAATQQSVQGVN